MRHARTSSVNYWTASEINLFKAMQIADQDAKPEFFRPSDSRRLFGISRAMMYEWIKEGKVESKVLRQRGKLTGIRLINYDSVKAFIESQLQGE